MTCCIPDCPNIAERSGKCASHSRAERKALEDSSKPPKDKKPIKKVGTKNTFLCSDGTRVTQAEINFFRKECYIRMGLQSNLTTFICAGCESVRQQGHAHIIPQARAKQIGKTELIWNPENIFFACHTCNSLCENVSSIGITKLKNYPRIKTFLELHDSERFAKICYSEQELHKI